MKLIAMATGAIALLTLAGGIPARAADLGYGDVYEDERSREGASRVTRRYVEREEIEERYDDDDDDGDRRLPPPARAYGSAERYADDCAPRHVVRDRLLREGWRSFRELDVRRGEVLVEARRPNGLPYHLTIDRCSGDIVSARPLEPVPDRPYAYGPRRVYGYGPYIR